MMPQRAFQDVSPPLTLQIQLFSINLNVHAVNLSLLLYLNVSTSFVPQLQHTISRLVKFPLEYEGLPDEISY